MSQESSNIGMNELVDYKKVDYGKGMRAIMEFLWKCGGSDKKILEYAPYSDHIKHAGIGGVVVATTIMATMAMGFAMHTIFASPDPSGALDPITGEAALKGNWLITAPVSIIWGLIIFNLDRFIVSTVKGDGTEIITVWRDGKSELLSMLPRLAMAILIGLTISAPLETYIFRREIDREWNEVKTQLSLKARFDLNNEMNNDGDLQSLSKTTTNDSTAYYKFKSQFDSIQLYRIMVQKCTDEPCKNHQPTIDYKNQIKTQMEASLVSYVNDTTKLREYKTERTLRLQSLSDSIKKLDPGFLDQIMMLERLSGEGKKIAKYDPETGKKIILKNGKADEEEIYGSAFWPIWLVRFLFMIVEIAPVIFKFMLNKSSYDWMQENVAQILEAKQGIALKEVTDEDNNMHRYRENYNAIRIAEVAKHQNNLETENSKHAMNLYAAKEKGEMDNDIDKFIKND
jgi:hypothetical protein